MLWKGVDLESRNQGGFLPGAKTTCGLLRFPDHRHEEA